MQQMVLSSVLDLPHPLCTLAIDVATRDQVNADKAFRHIKRIVVPLDGSSSHRYPAHIKLTVRIWHNQYDSQAYRLKRSRSGALRYTKMKNGDVQDLIAMLPGGVRSGLWGDRHTTASSQYWQSW